MLFGGNSFPVNGKTILITGGSKGLGRSAGRQLAEKGANIIIVARSAGPLKEAIEYISEGASSPSTQHFHTLTADLTSATECARVIAEARALNDNKPLDTVWCCAGSSIPTLFIDTPTETLAQQMDSNYFSTAYIAHAALRAWLRPDTTSSSASNSISASASSSSSSSSSKPAPAPSNPSLPPPTPRHLIFTSSFLALYTIAGYSAYSPSKSALRSLSDTLSQELLLYSSSSPSKPPSNKPSHSSSSPPTSSPIPIPIKIHTLYPASIFTDSYSAENLLKSDLTKKLEEDDGGQTPDECAQACIQGLEAGLESVCTSFFPTKLVQTSVLGGSLRGGWWRGLLDVLMAWVMVLVIPIVRWDHDRKIRGWGKKFGDSGMRSKETEKGEGKED